MLIDSYEKKYSHIDLVLPIFRGLSILFLILTMGAAVVGFYYTIYKSYFLGERCLDLSCENFVEFLQTFIILFLMYLFFRGITLLDKLSISLLLIIPFYYLLSYFDILPTEFGPLSSRLNSDYFSTFFSQFLSTSNNNSILISILLFFQLFSISVFLLSGIIRIFILNRDDRLILTDLYATRNFRQNIFGILNLPFSWRISIFRFLVSFVSYLLSVVLSVVWTTWIILFMWLYLFGNFFIGHTYVDLKEYGAGGSKYGYKIGIPGIETNTLEQTLAIDVVEDLVPSIRNNPEETNRVISNTENVIRFTGLKSTQPFAIKLVISLSLVLFGAYLSRLFLVLSLKASLTTAEAARHFDNRNPILFLRPFSDDQVAIPKQALSFTGRLWNKLAIQSTLDEEIVRAATLFGPPIAFGDPMDERTPFGTFRHYVRSKRDWKEEVADIANDASAIIICADDSEGVIWELKHIMRNSLLDKSLLLIHPRYRTSPTYFAYIEELAKRLSDEGVKTTKLKNETTVGKEDGRIIGIRFVNNNSIVVYRSSAFSLISFRLVLRIFFREQFGAAIDIGDSEFADQSWKMGIGRVASLDRLYHWPVWSLVLGTSLLTTWAMSLELTRVYDEYRGLVGITLSYATSPSQQEAGEIFRLRDLGDELYRAGAFRAAVISYDRALDLVSPYLNLEEHGPSPFQDRIDLLERKAAVSREMGKPEIAEQIEVDRKATENLLKPSLKENLPNQDN